MNEETPGGVRAKGEVAEVWQNGRQVGTLWDWRLWGHADEWSAEAQRQSFAGSFGGGDVGVRFFITAASEHLFQMRGEGLVTQYVAGGKLRHPCRMEGRRLWAIALTPSVSNSTTAGGPTCGASPSETSPQREPTSTIAAGTTTS